MERIDLGIDRPDLTLHYMRRGKNLEKVQCSEAHLQWLVLLHGFIIVADFKIVSQTENNFYTCQGNLFVCNIVYNF